MSNDAHEQASFPTNVVLALAAMKNLDSFVTAVTAEAVTVGASWVQLGGYVLGPQNYDVDIGPDLLIADDLDCVDIINPGRYNSQLNVQVSSPTDNGWLEAAIQPTLPELWEWPTEGISASHHGTYIPQAAAAYPGVALGITVGYTTPVLRAPANISGWVRYMTTHGGDATPSGTISVKAILYVNRVTA